MKKIALIVIGLLSLTNVLVASTETNFEKLNKDFNRAQEVHIEELGSTDIELNCYDMQPPVALEYPVLAINKIMTQVSEKYELLVYDKTWKEYSENLDVSSMLQSRLGTGLRRDVPSCQVSSEDSALASHCTYEDNLNHGTIYKVRKLDNKFIVRCYQRDETFPEGYLFSVCESKL